ncbi:MAG: hypothetical protein HGA72_06550 [Chlorobiaceae bacterium]|nr:hypothetical protein [Chlorobiaceae bacterium]NTW62866.1 hypothetical protein [Chlorobiaceae bacterium]
MKKIFLAMVAVLNLVYPVDLTSAATVSGIRSEQVRFSPGASSAVIKGTLKGDGDVDYVVPAGAGQTLAVTLKKTNPQNYFNIIPPDGSMALFVGQSGNDFKGVLPGDGNYTVRVYLMRPAARRNETSNYTLTVSVTGKPLKATPASKDALIPGTPFHASTSIVCELSIDPKIRNCEAFVIRRGFDGTATVVAHWPDGMKRSILFVKGRPVTSDAQTLLTGTKKGRLTIVSIGTDERYEIPDELIFGG